MSARATSTPAGPSTSFITRVRHAVVPLALVGVVLLMILPIPGFLLDLLLAASISLSLAVFLAALHIEKALELSSFPAVLLFGTLFRLSLNVASTRLILLHGHEGSSAAGHLIEAFGQFVIGGDFVVGLVVFVILVIINFAVITKGAGRVAEVSARFTLDAMPGKQMAIDAELNAGVIQQAEARTRRRAVEQEADFYGAMDGASKFVRGDAVAGLIITAVNAIAGVLVGTLQHGMPVGQSASTFVVLAVGDGLVSQIPALLMSTAAAAIVTRAAAGEALGAVLAKQLAAGRKALWLLAILLVGLALVPGLPAIPFLVLAAGAVMLARAPMPAEPAAEAGAATPGGGPADSPEAKAADEVEQALDVDLLMLEVGYELVPLVEGNGRGELLDRIAKLRRQLASDLGIVVPPVHLRDNLRLRPGEYRLLVSGNEVGRGELRAARLLAMDAGGSLTGIVGEPTREPAFGLPAYWISPEDRDRAELAGYTVVEPAAVAATHLAELLRANAHLLLGRDELARLLERFARTSPKLVEELVPNLLTNGDVLRVLKSLLREGISIRDLRTILEGLADLAPQVKDPETLTELVRVRLSRQITASLRGPDGAVTTVVLDPSAEDALRRALSAAQSGGGFAIDAGAAGRMVESLRRGIDVLGSEGAPPLLLVAPDLRRAARAFFERHAAGLGVASLSEIEPATPVRAVARVTA